MEERREEGMERLKELARAVLIAWAGEAEGQGRGREWITTPEGIFWLRLYME